MGAGLAQFMGTFGQNLTVSFVQTFPKRVPVPVPVLVPGLVRESGPKMDPTFGPEYGPENGHQIKSLSLLPLLPSSSLILPSSSSSCIVQDAPGSLALPMLLIAAGFV